MASKDLQDLISKDDCGYSPLYRVLELCKSHAAMVVSDVLSVLKSIFEVLAGLGSLGSVETSFLNVKKTYALIKPKLEQAKLEKPHQGFCAILSESQYATNKLELNKDTAQDLGRYAKRLRNVNGVQESYKVSWGSRVQTVLPSSYK